MKQLVIVPSEQMHICRLSAKADISSPLLIVLYQIVGWWTSSILSILPQECYHGFSANNKVGPISLKPILSAKAHQAPYLLSDQVRG